MEELIGILKNDSTTNEDISVVDVEELIKEYNEILKISLQDIKNENLTER